MDFLVIDGKKYTEEQVRELFLNGEDDGDISDTPTIDSNHDSEEEYTIDDDADVAEVDDQAEQVPVDDLDFHASAENSSDSDSSSDLPLSSVGYVYGKNRYKWSKRAPTLGRTRRHNIITHLPGLKAAARNLQDKNPVNYWSLLITDEMISTIVDCTNEKITDLSSTYGETASFVNFTDSVEMKAFFGLLYLTSAFKSNHEDVEGLFASDGTGKSQNVHPNPRKLSVPTLSVLSLIDPVKNTNRNITADNWFTSIELVEELRKNQLTYVGT
ncbi:hypothetical protein PPYR_14896, partial [Photinus pyralis]